MQVAVPRKLALSVFPRKNFFFLLVPSPDSFSSFDFFPSFENKLGPQADRYTVHVDGERLFAKSSPDCSQPPRLTPVFRRLPEAAIFFLWISSPPKFLEVEMASSK